jgi:hypothetical protein
MSKLVYICTRHGADHGVGHQVIEQLSSRLSPDNIVPARPRIIAGDGILIGIINPVDTLRVQDFSVCLGALFSQDSKWGQPGSGMPDGSYALFRGDHHQVELLSDVLASRTIWYTKTDTLFIASTSQRAIVFLLQSYQPNRLVHTWMLSSGTLGPGLSWDTRIACLPGDARLVLDRESWKMKLIENHAELSAENLPDHEHERLLKAALGRTFDQLDLDPDQWVLPLSGGTDSRAILLMLKDRRRLRTVTWGLETALKDRFSDASIAQALAKHYELDHEYKKTDPPDLQIEQILTRFLIASEGRTDHVSGYMDGLDIWRSLHESGVCGVIRGDEAFGWRRVNSQRDVRCVNNLVCLSDYGNLEKISELHDQQIPERLLQRESESLDMWRDRIYQTFRIPVMLSSLNDPKTSYIEVVNPLLSRSIIYQVRSLPDHLRHDKKLFRNIVSGLSPDIGFATSAAIDSPANIFRSPGMVDEIVRELHDSGNSSPLTSDVIDFIEKNIRITRIKASPRRGIKAHIKAMLPRSAIERLSPLYSRYRNSGTAIDMDANRLAFRAYILSRMDRILKEDAQALSRLASSASASCYR